MLLSSPFSLLCVILFYFFTYTLWIMLLQLSWYFPLAPTHLAPHTPSLSQFFPPLFMSMGHVYVIWLLHFLYCTLHPHDYSVTTYLYFLIPSPLYPFPHSPLPSGNHQNILCIHDSISFILVCLVCFLDSIVDRFVFFAILLFIILIFFFLYKSL